VQCTASPRMLYARRPGHPRMLYAAARGARACCAAAG
jgi:hypothetical protein